MRFLLLFGRQGTAEARKRIRTIGICKLAVNMPYTFMGVLLQKAYSAAGWRQKYEGSIRQHPPPAEADASLP